MSPMTSTHRWVHQLKRQVQMVGPAEDNCTAFLLHDGEVEACIDSCRGNKLTLAHYPFYFIML